MKKFILLSLFTLLLLKSYSQWGYGFVNFDDTTGLYRIYIDASIPNNVWQIGAPHKPVFTSARSQPNAIVTDTLNPYPVSNNSVFYYRTSGDYNTDAHYTGLDFWYKMDCDTLIDFGQIEMSLDSGKTYYNIMTNNNPWWGFIEWIVYDSVQNVIKSSWNSNDTLVFTGISNGWYEFGFNEFIPEIIFDSILFRFTFHSSASSVPHDGWMIDDLGFHTYWESIHESGISCKAYPDPVKDILTLSSKTSITGYEIFNSLGYPVMKGNKSKLPLQIHVSDLSSGFYFYTIRFATGSDSRGKFIKIN